MNSADVGLANDYVRARDLRQELRKLEELIARRAERSPITVADEHLMTSMQARADSAYVAANRKAPPPLPLERPAEYRRRLAAGLQVYSPKWRDNDLNVINDDAALTAIEEQIFADAVANGRTYGIKPDEIRARERTDGSGHKVIEYDGGSRASYIRQFSREPPLAIFRSRAEYEAMSRDANLQRINEIIHQRPVPQPQRPHAGF